MTTANLQPTRLAKTRTPVRARSVSGGELLAAVRAERLARRVEAVRAAAGAYAPGHEFHGNQWTQLDAAHKAGAKAGSQFDHDSRRFWSAANHGDADAPNYEPFSPHSLFFEAGLKGLPHPKWVKAVRIGKLPERTSTNFAEGKREPGVSVLHLHGEKPTDVGTFEMFNPGKKYNVEGWLHHETGSDGEPLLVGARYSESAKATDHVQAAADSKTVVKVILQDDKGRVLILKDSGSQWDDLPGGHVHRGEDPVQGLIREVYEETGIRLEAGEVKLYREQAIPKPHGGRMLLYKAKADPQRVKLSEEHSGAAWVKRGQLGQRNLGRYAKDVEEAAQEASGAAHAEARAKAQAEHKRAATQALGLAAHAVADGQTAHPDGKAKVVGGMLAFMALGAAAAYVASHATLGESEGVPQEAELPQADGHAQSRTELLKPAAEDAVAELEAEKAAVEREQVARGAVVENEISKRLAKKARELEGARWERIADTEATATYGASALRVLDLAGFATVKWSQLDRPTKRHTHAKNQEQGEQPLGFVWQNGQAYPGDPARGPEECINCLCQLIGVRRKELSK